MRKNSKDVVVLAVTIVAALSIVFAVNTTIKSDKFRRAFEKEMAFRLDMEERVAKLRNEALELTNALKEKEVEIKRQGIRIELLEKDTAHKETDFQKLQTELDTLILLKEKLEENLKEELAKQVQETRKKLP